MSTESDTGAQGPGWRGLLAPMAAVVNRVLAMDPDAGARLRRLDGRSLDLELVELDAPVRLRFDESGLALGDPEADPADVTLRASVSSLLTLAMSGGQRGGRELEFRGDVGVAQDVQRLFRELEVDWEEQLSHVTGDVVAHQIGNGVRGFTGWLRHVGETTLANTGEYLTEEAGYLPAASEVEQFLSGVDRVRSDADRLEARVNRLRRQLEQGGGE